MATTKISKKQLPVDVVYSTDLGNQINEHNLSPAAHQDIRNSLATATILPSYNSATHKITFTTISGNTYEIDLPIENAVDNVSYNSSTYIITVHKLDGSSSTIDLSELVNTYTGGSSTEVTVTIDANNEITANINAVAASKISYDNTNSGLSGATTQAAIDELASEKVDKVTGKQLSTEDYTTAEKTKLSGIENNAEVNVIEGVKVNDISLTPDVNKDVNITVPTKVSDLTNDSGFIDKDVNNLTNYTTTTDLTTALNNKVDKVNGKQLSTEDYTTVEKTKLAGIESGAEVNIIETVKVNGTALVPDQDRAIDITVIGDASDINYDNTTSGLTADDVQEAIDELVEVKADASDLGTAAGKNFTTYLTPDGTELPESRCVFNAIASAVSSVYTPYGDITCAELVPALLVHDNVGHIYDVTDSGTTTQYFIGGAGRPINIGDNVGIVATASGDFKFNLMAGITDLSMYQKKELDTPITIDGQNETTVESALGALNTKKVDKVTGKQLSTEDYTTTEKTKLAGIESNADVNTIEIVKVNGTSLAPDANKAVDVTVPTKVSDLTNDSGFIDKDVDNLTNYTKTSNLATVATSGSYNDLSDQPTIPTVNNATLTIQKNSTTIDTFTANASVDKTINISVPTKTSDLTNDSDFVADANYVHTDSNYTTAEKTKLGGIAEGAQVNTIETIKINGSALTPDANKAIDITVTPCQYETMPTAASAIEGKIVQYIGTTTTTAPIYTNGYFYKCVESSETAGTYLWEEIDVMDVSEYVTAENIQGQVSISAIPITPLNNTITYNMFTSDVKGRFVETFSGTTDPSSSLGKDGDIYFLID